MADTGRDREETGPRVSVITAAMNALPGLKETVASVAAQTCRDVEHVIVDGASTDGTRDWLEEHGGGVRWISEPDDGIADAMNKGIAMARGAYTLVLHAEDTFLDAGSLERAIGHLAGGEDIVSFDVLIEEMNGTRRYRSTGLNFVTRFFSTTPHQGAFCRRDLFDRIGDFDASYRIAMDYEFFMRAHVVGATVKTVPELLAIMPYTGVSSQTDWPSLAKRFSECRRAQKKNYGSIAMRAIYAVHWPLYLLYRRTKSAVRAAL